MWPAGTKLRFMNKGGWPRQREEAQKVFSVDKVYAVKSSEIFDWTSEVSFEEVDGEWNTTMFEEV